MRLGLKLAAASTLLGAQATLDASFVPDLSDERVPNLGLLQSSEYQRQEHKKAVRDLLLLDRELKPVFEKQHVWQSSANLLKIVDLPSPSLLYHMATDPETNGTEITLNNGHKGDPCNPFQQDSCAGGKTLRCARWCTGRADHSCYQCYPEEWTEKRGITWWVAGPMGGDCFGGNHWNCKGALLCVKNFTSKSMYSCNVKEEEEGRKTVFDAHKPPVPVTDESSGAAGGDLKVEIVESPVLMPASSNQAMEALINKELR